VKSIYHMTQAVVSLDAPARAGGCIINTGSTAGIRPPSRLDLVQRLERGGRARCCRARWPAELAPDKIRVQLRGAGDRKRPALLESFMGAARTPPPTAQKFNRHPSPLGRLVAAERRRQRVPLTFASDEAEFITGVVLEVDGGGAML